MKRILSIIMIVLAVAGCSPESDPGPAGPDLFASFLFDNGMEGWVGQVAEYPINVDPNFEVDASALPDNVSSAAARIAGNDSNEDLFMFMSQELGGLNPNTTYDLIFAIDFVAENLEDQFDVNSSGILNLKAGATSFAPNVRQTQDTIELGYQGFISNFNKGNNSLDGDDLIAIGQVMMSREPNTSTAILEVNSLTKPFRITSDSNGEIWVTVGTDSESGLEHAVYYDRITISAFEVGN